jgi:hypothetical protein
MKSDSLNGVLTFVLGVLVVLGVYFALRVVFVSHDSRMLLNQMAFAGGQLKQASTLAADTAAYNQKYPSPELTRILQSLQPPSSR